MYTDAPLCDTSQASVTKRRPHHHILGALDPRRPHSAVICQYCALVIFSYPPDVTSHSTHFPPHTIHTRRLLWHFTKPLLLLRWSVGDAIYTICTKVQNNNLKKSFFVWIVNRYPKNTKVKQVEKSCVFCTFVQTPNYPSHAHNVFTNHRRKNRYLHKTCSLKL